jgi:hypothetical protein
MSPLQFFSVKPGKGWALAMFVFSLSWLTITLVPLFVLWTVAVKGKPSDWELLWMVANWGVASCFVFAMFTNLTKLADRIRQLEESAAASRQAS